MILIDGTFSHFYIRFTHDLNKAIRDVDVRVIQSNFISLMSFREITISTNVHCIGTFNNKEYICIGYCMVF